MKKLILALLFLLLSCPVFAENQQLAWMGPVIVGNSTPVSGTVYTDCSNIGTAQFYYNADYSADNTDGCKGVSTSVAGTITGTYVSVATPPSSSPESGGNALKIAAGTTTSDYLSFPVSSGDIFSSAQGILSLNVYIGNASADTDYFFRARYDANNDMQIRFLGTNAARTTILCNSADVTTTSSATIPENTWTNIKIRWDTATEEGIWINIGNAGWVKDSDSTTLTAMTNEPTSIRFGYNTATDDIYIDDIFIWTSSGL